MKLRFILLSLFLIQLIFSQAGGPFFNTTSINQSKTIVEELEASVAISNPPVYSEMVSDNVYRVRMDHRSLEPYEEIDFVTIRLSTQSSAQKLTPSAAALFVAGDWVRIVIPTEVSRGQINEVAVTVFIEDTRTYIVRNSLYLGSLFIPELAVGEFEANEIDHREFKMHLNRPLASNESVTGISWKIGDGNIYQTSYSNRMSLINGNWTNILFPYGPIPRGQVEIIYLYVGIRNNGTNEYHTEIYQDAMFIPEQKITVTSTMPSTVHKGDSHTVTWTSEYVTGQVRILLETGTGYNYTIKSQTANDGTELITIPKNFSSGPNCKIKVISTGSTTLFGLSNPFTLKTRFKITSPPSGYILNNQSNTSVTWESDHWGEFLIHIRNGNQSYNRVYKNGSTATLSGFSVPSGSYQLEVARVENTGEADSYPNVYDGKRVLERVSIPLQVIIPGKEINITSPREGLIYNEGDVRYITWRGQYMDNPASSLKIEVFYSPNPNQPPILYKTFDAAINYNSQRWIIDGPVVESDTYFIKMTAADEGVTVTSKHFSILGPPFIDITTNYSNSELLTDLAIGLRWRDNFSVDVSIELEHNGSTVAVLNPSADSDGYQSVIIPLSVPNGDGYRFKIAKKNDYRVFDTTSTFSVKTNLKLLSPVANSEFNGKDTIDARWQSGHTGEFSLRILDGANILQSMRTTNKSELMKLVNVNEDKLYTLELAELSDDIISVDPNNLDYVDGRKILDKQSIQIRIIPYLYSLELTSPTSNQQFFLGDEVPIKWSSVNFIGNEQIRITIQKSISQSTDPDFEHDDISPGTIVFDEEISVSEGAFNWQNYRYDLSGNYELQVHSPDYGLSSTVMLRMEKRKLRFAFDELPVLSFNTYLDLYWDTKFDGVIKIEIWDINNVKLFDIGSFNGLLLRYRWYIPFFMGNTSDITAFKLVIYNPLYPTNMFYKDVKTIRFQESKKTINYITNVSMLKPHLSEDLTDEEIIALDRINAAKSIEYSNGLGLLEQSVAVQASTTGKDIVQAVVYDKRGISSTSYLPFISDGSNGKYKANALYETVKYYEGAGYDENKHITRTNFPFSSTKYEISPLNRVQEVGSIGSKWQPVDSNFTGRTVKSFSHMNKENEVRFFDETGDGRKFYPANQLKVSEMIDQEGKRSYSYTDFSGKQIYSMATNEGILVETYYVYDKFGQLLYEIPPMAVEDLKRNNWKMTGGIKSKWITEFTYDSRHRLISKKTPESGEIHYVYDRLGRLILSQDERLREEQNWAFTKYDQKGRVIYSGMIWNPNSREQLQDDIDRKLTQKVYEEKLQSHQYSFGYTTQNSIPEIYNIQNVKALHVNYYDDYENQVTRSINLQNMAYTDEFGNAVYPSKRTFGFLTASRTMVLDENRFLENYQFYDDKGRVIFSSADNAINSEDKLKNYYDWLGNVTKSEKSHDDGRQEIIEIPVYDELSRPVYTKTEIRFKNRQFNNRQFNKIFSLPKLNEWGESYEVLRDIEENSISVDSNRYTASSFVLKDYSRSTEEGLTNLIRTEDKDGGLLFQERLAYDDASGFANPSNVTARYNGLITAMEIKQKYDNYNYREYQYSYQYDDFSQLKGASYHAIRNAYSSNSFSLENVTYDLHGNIKTLDRRENYGYIDRLRYYYDSSKPNQLRRVNDSGDSQRGYSSQYNSTRQYKSSGNLWRNEAQGVQNIDYNLLNLTEKIKLDNNVTIENRYAANGSRLERIKKINNTFISSTVYSGLFQYENTNQNENKLHSLSVPGGRLVDYNNGDPRFEYYIQDHLGNVRQVVENENNYYLRIRQDNHYYPFGMRIDEFSPITTNTNKKKYQGDFAEEDDDLKLNVFALRNYDPSLGRWTGFDPYEQYYSPYIGMGNNPVMRVDPDGGFDKIHKNSETGETTVYEQEGNDQFFIDGKLVSEYGENGAWRSMYSMDEVTFYANNQGASFYHNLFGSKLLNNNFFVPFYNSANTVQQQKDIFSARAIANNANYNKVAGISVGLPLLLAGGGELIGAWGAISSLYGNAALEANAVSTYLYTSAERYIAWGLGSAGYSLLRSRNITLYRARYPILRGPIYNLEKMSRNLSLNPLIINPGYIVPEQHWKGSSMMRIYETTKHHFE
jgi:RHS repeat-associated protein